MEKEQKSAKPSNPAQQTERRRRRVRRLKKMILTVIALLILIPTIGCICLWRYSSHLNREIQGRDDRLAVFERTLTEIGRAHV